MRNKRVFSFLTLLGLLAALTTGCLCDDERPPGHAQHCWHLEDDHRAIRNQSRGA